MKISVIGLGSWPLALANTLNDNGHDVLMWSALVDEVEEFNNHHTASKYVKDVVFDSKMRATSNLQEIAEFSNVILIGVPTKYYRDVVTKLNSQLSSSKILINVSKGIEPETYKLISEIITEVVDNDKIDSIVNLTGPSHAEELVLRMVTTLVSASTNINAAKLVQDIFSNNYLRVYTTDDLVGTQLVSALKNIIAIAAGALSGLERGDNVKAALITRGLAEITKYSKLRGAKTETIFGLAGLGDLIVTTSSVHSRNFQAGYRIGKGENPKDAVNKSVMVVEGIRTCQAVVSQLDDLNIEMPIVQAVYDVYFNDVNIDDAIHGLMTRALKGEWGENYGEGEK